MGKNMEAVHPDTAKMMKKSKSVLVREIGSSGPKGRKKKSVTALFWSGIKTLMKNLHATEPYFVRCVNPNMQKSSTIWDEKVVEHQLRCGGLVEALKVLKLGYPTRVPYSTLYDRYHGNVTNPLIKNMGPEAFSSALLIAFDVNEEDYELGLTKIFFKPSKAAVLDTIMSKAGQPLSTEQNDKITKYIVSKRCKQIVGTVKAFTALRKLVRMKRAEKEWREKGRIVSLIGGTVLKHLHIARKQIRERKEKQAAILMQSYFRSMYERRHFIKHSDKMKKSTKMIWISYNSMKQRQGLTEWLDTKVEQRKIENERLQIENKQNDKAAAAITPKLDIKPVVIVPEKKESEITKDQRLETPKQKEAEQKIEDDKAKIIKDEEAKRIKDEEPIAFRDEVQSKQLEQERVSTHSVEEQKVSDAERVKIKKRSE